MLAYRTPDKSKLHPPGAVEAQYRQMEQDLAAYWGEQPEALHAGKVENVACSLCGCPPPPAGQALFRKSRFPYFRCPSCTLVYPSPRPRGDYIHAQYRNGRFAHSFRDVYLPTADYRMATIFRERVEEIIMPRVPGGRILDVGCGSGHFLKVAADHGFEVHGIEPNEEMASYAREVLKLPHVMQGVLEGQDFPPASFDVVTLWDVVEHVPEPDRLLGCVHALLRDGGWAFAYTENVESFNVHITGADSEIFAPDVHLRHYSPKTFRMEFEKAGLVVREMMTRGLDVQHIQTTINLHPGRYPEELRLALAASPLLQAGIDACGKGDNIRLFAQKDRSGQPREPGGRARAGR